MADESSNRTHDLTMLYVLAAIFGVLILQWAWQDYAQVEQIPYSQFDMLVADNRVAEVTVGNDRIEGTLNSPLPSGNSNFVTTRVDPAIADRLAAHGVTVNGVASGGAVATILSWVLPVFIFYAIWVFLFRRMAGGQGFGGGLMSIGKSRAKVYVETDTKVTFANVAGSTRQRRNCRRSSPF